MKRTAMYRAIGFLTITLLGTLPAQVSAGQAKRGITGDWQIKVDFNGRQMTSIVSFSRDKEDELVGEWISFWGLSELKYVKHEGKELSFVQTYRFGEGESSAKFVGAIERGKLSGTLSGDRGEFNVEGKRLRSMSRAVGNWDMKIKVGEREFTATLVVKAGKDGKLTADWQSQWGEHEISDVKFKGGKLKFKRKSKVQEQQWESTFEGTIKGYVLSGTFKSQRGDIVAEGKRLGAALIGKWDLKITSERGNRTQRLKVNPDLSGMYGPTEVKRINLEDDQVTFERALEFGERKFEINFEGKLDGKKLTGEITTPRGSRKVAGQKRGRAQAKKPLRKPDVIWVPTPPEVVDKMLELAEVKKDDLLYDLGCGDGIIVVTAAKRYGCKAVGYDIARKRVKESLANVEKNNVGHLVRIEQKDIFTLDLSEANVITLYLLPSLNVKLIPQLEKLKPGSRIVSHDFDMKGVKPDKIVKVNSDRDSTEHTVYLWTTPLTKVPVIDTGTEFWREF